MKAGTKLLQQLFVASQAGRRVEMKQVLKHELSHVQLALAKVNALKSHLISILSKETTSVVPGTHIE